MLNALATRRPTARRIALVVAHPDDETIAAGASLHLLPNLLLIHVTDGAPRAMHDAARLGFETPAEYAAAREAELQSALAVAGVDPARIRFQVPDQEASHNMPAISALLRQTFKTHAIEAVITHAYEGGHPDHDATALAVHRAAAGRPILEFAGYHAGPDAEMTVQRFLPMGPETPPETRIQLDPEEAAHKQAMLDCFRTQSGILDLFGASVERFRPAPEYDFTEPPHEGRLNYENWHWPITGRDWRNLAAHTLQVALA
jgi:LmbE family N-acetylglucosaminyl deacetylase